jgi:hypothetical protein
MSRNKRFLSKALAAAAVLGLSAYASRSPTTAA